ncbi:DNA-binding protein [Paenochrobactrum pullorum]|uniref:DNA-binding protein n=1 Tax=Paenochrobactrum pullorum TaxID=1324351 RepID=UPI0035BC81CF
MMIPANDNILAADLLTGADAIATFLGWNRRQVYHAVSKRTLPAFKLGDMVCARKSKIIAFIEAQEAA